MAGSAGPLTAAFDATAAIAGFGGAALLLSAGGSVLDANAQAAPLAVLFAGGKDPELSAEATKVAEHGGSHLCRVRVHEADGERIFDLMLLAVDTEAWGRTVLVLGRDSTLDASLGRALLASRQLFRDLVDCSADFAWETDAEGRFSFVSPRGALGFSAKELIGRQAADLVDTEATRELLLPFDAPRPTEEVELWLRTADGGAACVRTSSRPVRDDVGGLLGARGVCRDITEIKAREMALVQARSREQLTRSIIDTIRTALQPEQMFKAATSAIAEVLGASHVTILRHDESGAETIAAEFVADGQLPFMPPAAHWKRTAPDAIINHGEQKGRRILSAPCRYQEQTKAHLCVAWSGDAQPPEDVADLLNGVSTQLGIVVAQAEIQEKLERLSNTDDLTGLLNRRAFCNAARRRLAHHRRYGRPGALLYLDLDNFKAVNDTHGHQRGDDALRELAALMTDDGFRASDITGRLGGDEFALWLEETELEGAQHIAELLLDRAKVLATYSGSPDKPLSVSVGIAVTDPAAPEELDELMARADAAMYRAKHGQKEKGRIFVAAPPHSADED